MKAMHDYLPIENNPTYSRHLESMGVVNTDLQSRNRYIAQRNKILEEKRLLSGALFEIGNLKQDLDDLRRIVENCLRPAIAK